MAPNADPAHTADAIVIGGGIIGCSIAFRLAQARLKVMVLDRGKPGAEASSAAAGMLAPQGERVEPPAFSELCLASRDLYRRFVAEIEETSGRAVGYRQDGSLLVALDDEQAEELRGLRRAQRGRGLRLELLEPGEVHRRVRGLAPGLRLGLFVPGDHWVDNEALVQALVESCRRLGVKFQGGQAATRLIVKGGRVEGVPAGADSSRQRRAGYNYSAATFVLAAGCWSQELVAPFGINLAMQPCRGQMLEFDTPEQLPLVVRAGHHYLVPRRKRRILVGTTAEYAGFQKAVTGGGLRSILEGVGRLAPLVSQLRFRRAWAGLRPDTADHLPILGYGELENLVFATGHFRNGILLAPITAQLISELLLTATTSRPIAAYAPTRFA
jgi:glycine oxidase